jgi:glycine/D-amino acid oxidase-like deaminating enzyme
MSVVVVGAGIVGASVAYHLARLGVPVTLIERAAEPGAGVTADSFAWIGDAGGDWPGGAGDLRGSVRADYRRLAAEVPGVTVRWSGSLRWTDGSEPGPGQTWAGRTEIAALEPHLRRPPARAVHTPTDGGVDPVRTTRALVDAARALGAEVVLGSAVTSVRADGVRSSAGRHPASTVVLAAGTGVGALSEAVVPGPGTGVPTLSEAVAPGAGTVRTGGKAGALPVRSSPARLMRVATAPGLVRTVLSGPDFEAREVRPGQLLVTAPRADEAAAYHALERLRSAFPDAEPFRLLDSRIGLRPMPAGGPRIGYLTPDPPVYVAVMHSAVTLAATAGRLIAQELATGDPAAELDRCRPGRDR